MRTRADWLRAGSGLLVSILAAGVLIWLIDVRQVIRAVSRLNIAYLVPIFLLSLISFGTRSAGWKTILPGEISVWEVFLIVNAGYFLNTIFPFRLGEVGRAVLLKPAGIDFWEAVPTIILERIFDFIFAAALFLGALPFVLDVNRGGGYAASVAGVVVLGLLGLFLFVRYQNRIFTWLEGVDFLGAKVKSWIQTRLRSFLSGLSILSDPVRFSRAFLWMALSWGLALGVQYLLLRAFLPEARLLWAVFALGAVALGVSIPSSPGNIGVYEASLVAALTVFEIEGAVAFAYALVSHGINLSITTLVGSYTVVQQGFELRSVYEVDRRISKEGEL